MGGPERQSAQGARSAANARLQANAKTGPYKLADSAATLIDARQLSSARHLIGRRLIIPYRRPLCARRATTRAPTVCSCILACAASQTSARRPSRLLQPLAEPAGLKVEVEAEVLRWAANGKERNGNGNLEAPEQRAKGRGSWKALEWSGESSREQWSSTFILESCILSSRRALAFSSLERQQQRRETE